MRQMLIEVLRDARLLVLEDDSRWSVNPGDSPTCCTWTPTAPLEVKETDDPGMFPYIIENRENGASVLARPG
jgi:hypothetical protein